MRVDCKTVSFFSRFSCRSVLEISMRYAGMCDARIHARSGSFMIRFQPKRHTLKYGLFCSLNEGNNWREFMRVDVGVRREFVRVGVRVCELKERVSTSGPPGYKDILISDEDNWWPRACGVEGLSPVPLPINISDMNASYSQTKTDNKDSKPKLINCSKIGCHNTF